MATNLLLEGDDLEALLQRAATEGGANARILRAEKVRQGGFLGFFAREHFEVAVEIPDAVELPDPQAHEPVDRSGAAIATRNGSLSEDPMPEPGRPAAEGLLDLVDRVSAAEQAAARPPEVPDGDQPAGWWSSMETPAHGVARVSNALDGIDRAPGPWDEPEPDVPDHADEAGRWAATTDVEAERRRAQEQAAAEAVIRAAVESRRAASRDAADAAATAARPSTALPEFTTLLDTLRSDARPASRPPADPWTSPLPTGAMLPPVQRVPVPVRVRVEEQVAGDEQGAVEEQVAGERDDVATGPASFERVPSEPGQLPGVLAAVHPLHGTAQDGVSRIGPPVALVPPTARHARHARHASEAFDPHHPEDLEDDLMTCPVHQAVHTGDLQVSADRRALRRLGVPVAWTRRYKGGDRFTGVMRMLDRLPELDIDPDTRIVAVVGPVAAVTMEAHRTALDLATDDGPRAVVVIPSQQGHARRAAVALAQELAAGVVAIATDSYDDVEGVLDTLQAVGAGAVVVVVEAHRGVDATQDWLEALENVDALVVEGAAVVDDPAAVLQHDLPVVRLDGIGIDRVTWSALLCARLHRGGTAQEGA